MVRLPLARNRRGKIRIGCLIWVLLGLVVGYVGFEYARVYQAWFAARQDVEDLVAFAGQLEDEAIRRRIVERMVFLDLPPQARQVRLWRVERPRGIRVALSYADSVNLVFTKRAIELSIEVGRSF